MKTIAAAFLKVANGTELDWFLRKMRIFVRLTINLQHFFHFYPVTVTNPLPFRG